MDTVFINGLRVTTTIGVFDWERQLPRPLLIDLELDTDFAAAIEGDDVNHAIDYAAVAKVITQIAETRQPKLLETLAEAIAEALFEQFPTHALRLTVHKPGAVPGTQSVGVKIQRQRKLR
ncbi:dihydroneopterin aldolase [Sinimarinibacterium sp. NLF-5-8]|uniref:dihydroneopterin aldolase n=1 Tax=Sinimarinibacterium sp. NLF-5-8 TaxID=2698684 RepID=UPI00137B9F96|nr:dihydroneopterin aldolase [Sinimarinibacterium sp. NLF-5-8]QHS10822.1 dihydroneopterin aldolase [Sinimarinibacterium sp. NLF-5-8]